MKSLNIKYRPKTFTDVCGQQITTTILEKVVANRQFKNCYLFAGKSGCGKTTCARIFANEINCGVGSPIEIDAASHNGVDDIRAIIESSNQRSLTGEYKIYIIDEAHAITSAGWQAFLKGIEEPSPYTIYIFCTTEPNKIPVTILNRVQRFNFAAIGQEEIKTRLLEICSLEGFTNYTDACDFISKIACGGMRDAITYLEQVSDYSTDLIISNVCKVLGELTPETMLNLSFAIVKQNSAAVIQIIENLYTSGKDLRVFIDSYMSFVLDLIKYNLFKKMSSTKIPEIYEKNVMSLTAINTEKEPRALAYWINISNVILEIKQNIKNEPNYKSVILVSLLKQCSNKDVTNNG